MPVDNIYRYPIFKWVVETWLSHWGRVTHICVSKLIIIVSDNGLSPERRQAIIWTNAGILLIGPLGTNFNEILIAIHIFWFKKIHFKMSSGKRRPFCLGLNVLNDRALGYSSMQHTSFSQREIYLINYCMPFTQWQLSSSSESYSTTHPCLLFQVMSLVIIGHNFELVYAETHITRPSLYYNQLIGSWDLWL